MGFIKFAYFFQIRRAGRKEFQFIEKMFLVGWNVGERYNGSSSMTNPADTTKMLDFAFLSSDFDFIPTMEMQLTEGRNFSANYASDNYVPDTAKQSAAYKTSVAEWMNVESSRPIILTENTAEAIGLKKPYTGQVIKMPTLQGTVIGVVKEFQGLSLLEKSPLVVLKASPKVKSGFTYIRIHPTDISATLAFIDNRWKEFFPNSTYSFSFVDEKLQRLYTSK